MRRNNPRGQSVNAARCAALSTVALLGCAVAQGSLRALLAFVWVVLLITALGLEWTARRRLKPSRQRNQDVGKTEVAGVPGRQRRRPRRVD
jgi:hypothetical protein